MTNTETIYHFYENLQARNVEEMLSCYHYAVHFKDPAFGEVTGPRAFYMWRMLVGNKSSNVQVKIDQVFDQNDRYGCEWTATYKFGPKQRTIQNKISSRFIFKNNKILAHYDYFDFWKWSRQALGLPGYLFGWSNMMQEKVMKRHNEYLDKYIEKTRAERRQSKNES